MSAPLTASAAREMAGCSTKKLGPVCRRWLLRASARLDSAQAPVFGVRSRFILLAG